MDWRITAFIIAAAAGIYRHISGGSVNEQIIDGNLNSLGSPDTGLVAVAALEGGSFLALANELTGNGGSKLLKIYMVGEYAEQAQQGVKAVCPP